MSRRPTSAAPTAGQPNENRLRAVLQAGIDAGMETLSIDARAKLLQKKLLEQQRDGKPKPGIVKPKPQTPFVKINAQKLIDADAMDKAALLSTVDAAIEFGLDFLPAPDNQQGLSLCLLGTATEFFRRTELVDDGYAGAVNEAIQQSLFAFEIGADKQTMEVGAPADWDEFRTIEPFKDINLSDELKAHFADMGNFVQYVRNGEWGRVAGLLPTMSAGLIEGVIQLLKLMPSSWLPGGELVQSLEAAKAWNRPPPSGFGEEMDAGWINPARMTMRKLFNPTIRGDELTQRSLRPEFFAIKDVLGGGEFTSSWFNFAVSKVWKFRSVAGPGALFAVGVAWTMINAYNHYQTYNGKRMAAFLSKSVMKKNQGPPERLATLAKDHFRFLKPELTKHPVLKEFGDTGLTQVKSYTEIWLRASEEILANKPYLLNETMAVDLFGPLPGLNPTGILGFKGGGMAGNALLGAATGAIAWRIARRERRYYVNLVSECVSATAELLSDAIAVREAFKITSYDGARWSTPNVLVDVPLTTTLEIDATRGSKRRDYYSLKTSKDATLQVRKLVVGPPLKAWKDGKGDERLGDIRNA